MRILLVNDHAPGPTGGAEVHVGRLHDALAERGDAVELFVAQGEHRGLARVRDIWDPAARHRLARRVAVLKPDVVHYHNVLNELSTSVVGLGVPSVLTVHDPRLLGIRFGLDHDRSGLAPRVALRDAKNRVARHRLRRAVHATIAPSRSLADALARSGFPEVHHVPNFAPAVDAGPPGGDLLFVGNVSQHKGPHVLLDAFSTIAQRHPDTTLRFIGAGPMTGELRSSALAAGLEGRVVFEGAVDPAEVATALRVAALVVVPSLGVEGGGPTLAVIEAMSAGRPVVVSDRPGVCDGVDAEVGAVVPAGDVGALAAAVDGLLADRAALVRRGETARRRAAVTWSASVVVPQIRAIYARLARAAV